MLSTFDYEKLEGLLKDYYQMTGIRITIFDDSFHELISYPEKLPDICRFIRQNEEAEKACHQCDRDACRTASVKHAPYVYRCHAGLTEAVAPVFLGSIPVAYLLFGHLFSYPDKKEGQAQVIKACSRYGLDNDKLEKYVEGLSIVEKTYILSASHILQAVASYLCMDRMITLRQQETMAQIDEYITGHFAEDLDVTFLCERFGVGKTSLYAFAKQNYGCGIAEYIRKLRIEHAKRLLREDTEMPIALIAEKCGFHDYNYFITVFSRLAGCSPRKYRYTEK